MKILFLYTELSGYFLSCIKELSSQVEAVHIFRWPVVSEAPFKFNFPQNVIIHERKDYNNKALIKKIQNISPSIIIASGWVDKGYLKACQQFKYKMPTVMAMDNQWHGSIKQQLMSIFAPLFLKKIFSHAWVAGEPQKTYAKKLGFSEDQISTGFYSADVPLFSSAAVKRINTNKYPHRLLYIGRYVHAKGLDLLFKSFIELKEEIQSDWELWCAGTGNLFEQRPEHTAIKHMGFLQPNELKEVLSTTGVFVLPSRYEPWGVVVHEMAAAGFPMVISSSVGAGSQFLENNKNGYIFKNDDYKSLKKTLKKIMMLPNDKLAKMAKHSYQLGINYTPKEWTKRLFEIIDKK